MKHSKALSTAGAVAIAMGTVVTSAVAAGPVAQAKSVVNIVWAAPPIGSTLAPNQALVNAFNKSHSGIHVKLQSQSTNTDTNRASLTTVIGGGSASPDIYMGDVIWPAQFANSQLAQPLNSMFPKSFWNRFSNGLVAGATYKGQIYAAPFFADTAFLFYRKDLLKKAGLKVPTTWQQVENDAKTLVKKHYVKYGFVWQGASYEGLTCDFMEYLASAGGSVLNAKGQPTLTTPQATKALSFMRSLVTSGASPSAVDTFQEPQSEDVFVQGNAAFLRNWTYAWNDSQTAKTSKVVGKVGVATLPSFSGAHGYSTVGGWDLYVNPHSKNLKADATFLDWMTGPQAQGILAKTYGMIPVNAKVAAEPAVKKENPPFSLLSKLNFVSRPDQSPNYPQLSKAIYSNVNAALSGSTSVAAALKSAQSQIQQAQSSGGGL